MTEPNNEPLQHFEEPEQQKERHTARNVTVGLVGLGVVATGALLFPDVRERKIDVGYICPDDQNIGTVMHEKLTDENVSLVVPCDGQEDRGKILRVEYAKDGKLVMNLLKNSRPSVQIDRSAEPDRITLHGVHSLISANVISEQ